MSLAKIPIPVKASIWFAVCSIIQKCISLICMPIFTRLLTAEQYGAFTIFQSTETFVKLIATFNIYADVFMKGLLAYKDDKDSYISSMQGVITLITAVVAGVYFLGRDFWNERTGLTTMLAAVMFIDILMTTANSLWMASQRFQYKYKSVVAVTLAISVLSVILGLGAVLLSEHKAEARIVSFVLAQTVFGTFFYVHFIRKGKRIFSKVFWSYAISNAIPLLPHYLSLVVLQQADRIMIGRITGMADAALYSVAYTISNMMVIITVAINDTYCPFTYKALEAEEHKKVKQTSVFLMLLMGGMCVLAMLFGPEVIRIFAAPEYYEAVWVMPPVAASVFFMFLFQIFRNISFYYGEVKIITLASLIGSVSNLFLNAVFIPMFGYVAAGYTTLVCYMLISLAHYICQNKVLAGQNKERVYHGRQLLAIITPFLMLTIGINFTYPYPAIRYLLIIGLALTAFVFRNKIISQLKALRSRN